MDLVYIHPGGVRTAMYLFFCCKVLFEKDPSDHGSILFFVVFHFCHFWAFFQFRAVFHFGAFLHIWVGRGVRGVRGGH